MTKNIEEILKNGADVVHTCGHINDTIFWIKEEISEPTPINHIDGWVSKIQRCLNGLQDYSIKYPESRFIKTSIRDVFSNAKDYLPDNIYKQIRKSYRIYSKEAAKKQ